MAFTYQSMTKITNLLAPADSTGPMPALWAYVTADSLANMLAANYFNNATWLVAGSYIDAYSGSGKQTLSVVSNTAGVVAVANGATLIRGQSTTVTANDVIVTGLAGPLTGVVATFNDDIGLTEAWVTANIGNQAGVPASGSFNLKTWEPTSNANPTPIAATTFGKKVNWIAWM